MDERMLRALVAAGAVKTIRIVASGARFHVEARTPNGAVTAETLKGKVRTGRWHGAGPADPLAAGAARVDLGGRQSSLSADGQSLPNGNGLSSVLNVR